MGYTRAIFTKRLTTMANGALRVSRRRAGRKLLNEKIGSGISSKKATLSERAFADVQLSEE